MALGMPWPLWAEANRGINAATQAAQAIKNLGDEFMCVPCCECD